MNITLFVYRGMCVFIFEAWTPSLFLELGLPATVSNVSDGTHEDCVKFEHSGPWLLYRRSCWWWWGGGALILPATWLPRPPLLLKAVLQSRRSGVGSPEFSLLLGTAPRPRPLRLPQAGRMTARQAHTRRISQMPGPGPAPHSWEGSALGWGGPRPPPPPRPCPRDREGLHLSALAAAGEVTSGLPSLPTSQRGLVKVQGGREEDRACLPRRQQWSPRHLLSC